MVQLSTASPQAAVAMEPRELSGKNYRQFLLSRPSARPLSVLLSSAILALALSAVGEARDFYVAPSGQASGDGSLSNPWNLTTALAHPPAVSPDDTIWLRGGTYRGAFTSALAGTPGAPIKVRQFPGERATIDGASTPGTNTLTINGSDTWYWGFEVTNSNPTRVYASEGDPSLRRGEGVYVAGPRTKFINMIVHDTQDGFGLWSSAVDAEIYGSLIYSNGHVDPVRGHGHGIYIQNETGTKRIRDVISFNNFATGMKAYGAQGYAIGVSFDGVISFNNGSPAAFAGSPAGYDANHRFTNLFVGTEIHPADRITVRDCMLYHIPGKTVEFANLAFGYTADGNKSLTVIGNYVAGGQQAIFVGKWQNATVTGNTFFAATQASGRSNEVLAGVLQAFPASYSWNNNTYFDNTVQNEGIPYSFSFNDAVNRFGTLRLSWTDWRNGSGFDSYSQYTVGRPAGTKVFIRPNLYEPGRAHIAIYNWNHANTVDVDVRGILPSGSTYEVRNAQDYFGPPVAAGISNGTPIRLPMTGLTVASPVGHWAPETTTPEFGVFVLLNTSANGPGPSTPAPTLTATPTATPPVPTATPTPAAPQPTPTPTRTPPVGTPLPTPPPQPPPPAPPPGPQPSGTRTLTVPVASHVRRLRETVATDLQIENPSESPVTASLTYFPAGNDEVTQVTLNLLPRQTLNYFDVVGNRFGLQNAIGALRLETVGNPPAELRMTSRTYTQRGQATFGQGVSGVVSSEETRSRFVTGLIRSEQFRTDLGVFNASRFMQEFLIVLYASDGAELGVSTSWNLFPDSQMRWDLCELFPDVSGVGLTAEFRPVAGSLSPLAYAVVTDELSGDPTYYPAIRPNSLVYLPGVTRVLGGAGNLYSSDISIANPADEPATITITFLEAEKENATAPSVTFTIDPYQTRQMDDALLTLFGLSETYGALAIQTSSAAGVVVSKRLYTRPSTTPGTVGEQVEPVVSDGLLSRGSVLGLREEAAFRSQVGLFNPNPFPVGVELELKAQSGISLGHLTLTLAEHGSLQRDLASLFSSSSIPAGQLLTLSIEAGEGRIFPFATIVDNVSQDLTFSPGLR